jgi:hypothetical protein
MLKQDAMFLNAQLTRQIQQLDAQTLEELRLYIEQLLVARWENKTQSKKKRPAGKRLLTDMERIPIPVNNVCLDRGELYDDRI